MKGESAFAVALRSIHRSIRLPDERVGILSIAREQADADACRQPKHVLTDPSRACQCRDEFRGDLHRVGGMGHVGQEDQEFIATVSTDGIRFAHSGGKAFGGKAQHLVADRVSQRIVDLFEIIEIDK